MVEATSQASPGMYQDMSETKFNANSFSDHAFCVMTHCAFIVLTYSTHTELFTNVCI